MDRRQLIIAASAFGAFGLSRSVPAQQGKVWRVGFLATEGPVGSGSLVNAFRDSMRKLGYVEGRNLSIEHRWPNNSFEEDPGVVAALVQSKVDVIRIVAALVRRLRLLLVLGLVAALRCRRGFLLRGLVHRFPR